MTTDKNASLWISANWALADKLVAGTTITPATTALEGFNLAVHVEDEISRVEDNRRQFLQALGSKEKPMWLSQYHSDVVVRADEYVEGARADAGIGGRGYFPLVLTADCVPIVLADETGQHMAVIHAGWQGLVQEIIPKTVARLACEAEALFAWIAPCIRQHHYEVDERFYQRFLTLNADYYRFFIANRSGHYLADLAGMARWQLLGCGVRAEAVADCGICTFADRRFFSFRRDGGNSGRMATFVVNKSS